jgi:4a-hydroxytetrahydrobiopterin dehydratase
MDRMSEDEIKKALQAVPEWSETGGTIHRTYQFGNFVDSMAFVNAIAAAAEADQHHPDILVRWNKVTLTLSTHDAGGITAKDFSLAAKADAMAPAPSAKPAASSKSKSPRK